MQLARYLLERDTVKDTMHKISAKLTFAKVFLLNVKITIYQIIFPINQTEFSLSHFFANSHSSH